MVWRRLLVICSLLLGLFLDSAHGQVCSYLVWSDEFSGSGAPDAKNWNFETGAGGWGNNELQNYTSSRENSYVQNGLLTIHAKKNDNQWTSARMVTAGKASWKYGRFEIRAKLPTGLGTWPAIWMMPAQSLYGSWPKSGEIDIMEHVGYDLGRVHGSVHTESFNHKIGTQKSGNILLSDVHTRFYTYAIEWTPESIKWFVDDQLYYTFENLNLTYKEWPFDHSFFLILNIAIGGDWGGALGIDPNLTEAKMEIDYVRIYSNTLPKPAITGPATIKSGSVAEFWVSPIPDVTYQWQVPEGATIIGGEGSNAIQVLWGDSAGNVTCTMASECETVTSDPIFVKPIQIPEGDSYSIPLFNESGEPFWSVAATTGNSLILEKQGDDLKLDYSITNPAANPYISMQFPGYIDFSSYNEMLLKVKILSESGPNIMRVDLIDRNGNNNLGDLFKIENPVANKHFNIYSHSFVHSTADNWLLEEIAEIRIYLNYGLLGKSGSGTVVFSELTMAPQGSYPDFTSPSTQGLAVSLQNDPTGVWNTVVAGEEQLNLIGEAGKATIEFCYLNTSSNGARVNYSFNRAVDLTQFAQLNLTLTKGTGWPSDMQILLEDVNGVVNPIDLFIIESFDDQVEPHTYKFVFGKKGDGGDFLLCRVKTIIFKFNQNANAEACGSFDINSMFFVEPEIDNFIFTPKTPDKVNFYPNPATDRITLILPVNSVQAVINLYTLDGSLVCNQLVNAANPVVLLPEKLLRGVYIIEAVVDGDRHVNKVLVE